MGHTPFPIPHTPWNGMFTMWGHGVSERAHKASLI